MTQLNLQVRLFSHILVTIIGVTAPSVVGNFFSPCFFQVMGMFLLLIVGGLAMEFNPMATSLEVEEKRREIIDDLTHELRTPLTIIRGRLEEIADGIIVANSQIYSRLIRETQRLQRLLNGLQELSQAEPANLALNLKPVNLRQILKPLAE